MLGSLGGWASLLGANRAVAAALARIAAAVLPAAPRRLASLPAAVEQRPTAAPTATSANVDAATLFYRSIALKKYAQAIDAGRGYLLANPGDDAFAIDLASAYIAAGRFNDARDLLQKRQAYLRAHPQAVSVWMDLAYRESDARWYVRAIDDIDQYLAYRPGDAQAQGQRALDVAAITPQPDTLFYGDVQQKRYAEAIVYGRRYLAEHPDNDSFAMDLAYAEIAAGNVDAAAAIADRRDAYLRAHPQNAGLLAALFYAYKDRKALQRAIRYGDEYLSLRPNDDAFAVDLAFADLQAGRETASRALVSARPAYLKAHPDAASIWLNFSYDAADRRDYPRAIADVDAYLTFRPSDASAKQQRAFYVNSLYGGPRYQAYGDVQYEQRFDDVFFELDQTYALAPARRIQPYLALHLTEDTNSGAPGTPQIFSDDVVVAGVGLRSHFGPNVSAFAEGGAGIGLRGQGTTGDVRYGVDYFQSWSRPHGAHTDVGLSAAVYSRYSGNLISYYDVLHDFGGKRLQPIVGINGGLDSRNVFGNSYVEGFAGVQTGTDALSFRLMEVGGTYLTRGVKTSTKLQYTTLRGMLIFGVSK